MSDAVASNHTLHSVVNVLGKGAIDRALGFDGALLRVLLKINNSENKERSTKHKVLSSHARGNFNLGREATIPIGAMPHIIACIGEYESENNANLIRYQETPIPRPVRLDSIYRIMREMSGFFTYRKTEQ